MTAIKPEGAPTKTDPPWVFENYGDAAALIGELEASRAADKARIAELEAALTAFIRAAYPVAHEINQRGYNWSDAYLDEALNLSKQLLPQQGKDGET